MKTLLSNIIGICSNASITIFDESTIGLESVNRHGFYNILLDSYMHNNRTIIISTHLINELEELLDKVVIIKDGEVKVDDYTDEVKDKSYYISGKKEDLVLIEDLNIDIGKMSFQDLFINMNKKGEN